MLGFEETKYSLTHEIFFYLLRHSVMIHIAPTESRSNFIFPIPKYAYLNMITKCLSQGILEI